MVETTGQGDTGERRAQKRDTKLSGVSKRNLVGGGETAK